MKKVFAARNMGDDLVAARHLLEEDPYLDVHIDGVYLRTDIHSSRLNRIHFVKKRRMGDPKLC